MELLLELAFPMARGPHSADVSVEIDPDDTVGSLAAALAGYAGRRGYADPPGGRTLVREATGRLLDPAGRVMDSGLVSGETVRLAAGAPRSEPAALGDAALSLDLTAGPEAGRSIPLRPGTVIVGRSSTCRVAIDDPSLSREHFAVQVSPEGQVTIVANPEATNGTLVEGELLTDPREVEPGEAIEAGASVFVVRSAAGDETRRRDRMGQVPFNRVPYRRTVVVPKVFPEVRRPPDPPSSGRLSIAAALMPAGSGVMLVAMTGNYMFLGVIALSPLLLVYRHLSDKRGGKRRFRRERAEFLERVDARAAEVDEALDEERRTRLTAAPDLAELAHQATRHMPRLWERDRVAGDLLDLRLGLGEVPSQVTAAIGSGGDEELAAEGVERLAHQGVVPDAPILVDVAHAGIVGLWGDREQVAAVGRSLVAQAACLHSPEDLVIAAALGAASLPGFEWLKWLPHVRSSTSPVEGDHLAVGPDGARRLLANLLVVAADRSDRSDRSSPQRASTVWPRVLVLLDEASEVDRALLSQLLDVAPAHGIHVLWLGESGLQMPRQCRAVVACPGPAAAGRVGYTDPSLDDRVVELDGTSPATATAIARALAPLRDASAASQTTAIPRVVPLLDAVGIDRPAGDVIVDRWRSPQGYGLELPIGVSAEGTFRLDLVEQGPHTLIGGTSGAGKSELLQTLVLSLAASYPPDRLNFLFVDYKGGASSAELRDLPHTVGYVTNLSGRMSLRALTSLRAELQRRMGLLEGKAKDLREMLAVAPEDAPPSLVIVVDEFAALVKEIPDFVAGIVDIAQRGRSLGVHLILATQRPTGVVNDNILANTNLRISLRMLDPADSTNVIGTRDAAEIPVPLRGRAYARTGPATLVPFQCAWSGAPYTTDTVLHQATVGDFTLASAGPLAAVAETSEASGTSDGAPEPPTQLEVLVEACAAAARALRLPPVRRPWVEPLGQFVGLGTVLERAGPDELTRDPGRLAVLGLYDDPENQAQHVSAVDLEATGGLIVFGTGGSGKTTLLRTVAAGLAGQGDPDEVQVYALDFASRGLEPLADLPHCGAVVPGDDVEQVTRLLTVLDREIEQRRLDLASARAENLGALRERTGTSRFPRIVVLLDGYSGFHSTFDRADRYGWLALLQRIVSAGRQVGVHWVLATDRRMGVPNALLSAISARCALRMATPDELTALGVPSKIAKDAELPNGRGFVDGSTEVQIACVSDDPSGVAQAEALAALGAKLAASTDARAPAVPALPDTFVLPVTGVAHGDVALAAGAVPSADTAGAGGVADTAGGAGRAVQPLAAPLGLVDLSLDTALADLGRQNLVVTGPPLAGRSTALETVALGLRASSGPGLQLVALGAAASPLAALDVWDDAAFARAGLAGVVERLADDLADDEGVDPRVALFVDTAEDVEGNDVLRTLEALTRCDALRLVVACEPVTLAKAYSGWLAALRRNRSVLVLQPESKADVDAVAGVKPDLRPGQPFPPGRGVYVAHRRWQLVQVGRHPGAGAAGARSRPRSS